MEYARKVVLVPEERFNRHIASEEQLSDLDKEMKKILFSKEHDDVKIKLYNEVLQKRINISLQNLPVKPDERKPVEETARKDEVGKDKVKREQTGDTSMETIIYDTVPKNLKRYAQNIVSVFKKHSNVVSWNSKGEFIFRGNVMRNSNIADLVDGLLRHNKNIHGLPASAEFLQVVKEVNLPSTYIKNLSIHKVKSVPSKNGKAGKAKNVWQSF